MTNPTTAITDALIRAIAIRLTPNPAASVDQTVAAIRDVLAMQSATPSTPDLEELVEGLLARSGLAEGPICVRAAGAILSLQKEIDTLKATLALYADDVECDLCERTVSSGLAARAALSTNGKPA